jgi:predicted nucleotidyltransferase
MILDPVIASKREEILRLAEKSGIYNVRVFGSFARGEAREDSDLDLLINMEDDRSLFELIGFWRDVKELVGREVDVVEEEAMSPYMKKYILKDAVLL